MSRRRILVGRPRYSNPDDPDEAYDYDSPHGPWQSSEQRLTIGPFGPETVRESSSGYPAIANGEPSRRIYRGSDTERADEYVRRGQSESITTRLPGDLHRHPGHRAAYFTLNEDYADLCARRGNVHGAVIQQDVPSTMLDAAYTFPAVPQRDWHGTVYANRGQDSRPPRDIPAIAQSRQRPVVIAPTTHVETRALLRNVREYSSGPRYEAAFRPAQEQERSSSEDSDIDEHRRGREYVQQVRFQGAALDELRSLPRHARPAHPDRRRR